MQHCSIDPLIIPQFDIDSVLFQSGKYDHLKMHREKLLQHLKNLVYVSTKINDARNLNYHHVLKIKVKEFKIFLKSSFRKFRARINVNLLN